MTGPDTPGAGTTPRVTGTENRPDPLGTASAGSTAERGTSAGTPPRNTSGSTSESVQGAAREAFAKTSETVESVVQSGKRAVAGRLDEASESVHRSADDLRPLSGWLAEAVDRGADKLGDFARSIESGELTDVAREVTRFGRERPVLFFGGAVLLGFALGRIARASLDSMAPNGHRDRGPEGGRLGSHYQGYGGAAHQDELATRGVGSGTSDLAGSRRRSEGEPLGSNPTYAGGGMGSPSGTPGGLP